jgi:hypothetical protein
LWIFGAESQRQAAHPHWADETAGRGHFVKWAVWVVELGIDPSARRTREIDGQGFD